MNNHEEHGCHCGHKHHGCQCSHDHNHEEGNGTLAEYKSEIIKLIIGALLLTTAIIFKHIDLEKIGLDAGALSIANSNLIVLGLCIIAYVLLGREVLMNSAKGIMHGEVFDENFLMAIATLAAFGIGDFPEAVGVMLFYNVGEMFEHISVDRSRKQIAEAVDMRPETVNLFNGSEIEVIPANEAKLGDLLQINPGNRIPLDGEVVRGEGIIDTAPITGEPTPIHAKPGDAMLSGCINKKGQFTLKVTAALEESMVSRILKSVENAAENKPQIEKFITKFARIYTPIVVVVALLTAILPPLILGAAWKYWIVTAVTFLVISCPCALVISVPLAYFLGVGSASKYGILVKSGQSLEALRKIKIVALDKTGTLTKGIVEDSGLLEVEKQIGEEGSEANEESFEEAFAKKSVIGDSLKDDAKDGIYAIHELGVQTAMLTGDKKERAFQIASEAGIEEANVRPELLPDEKLTALMGLREEHGEIMFVGDGVNDAPVLAGADVGAAMGSGADAAIESADIVFMNSKVGAISQIIKIAGRTGNIAKQNIVLALGIKGLVLALGFVGLANIWLAVFADTGVAMLCIVNSLRLLRK